MPVFAHPAALWALLGIPVVLAIHLLQKRSRRLPVTTLFLLQQQRRQAEEGRRLDRLRLSLPLWLQLLMVLLFTWLMSGPRWFNTQAVHRLVIVLDSSASMQAFRPQVTQELGPLLARLAPLNAQAELTLLSSDSEAGSLYYGASRRDLEAALSTWRPWLGAHDFTPALRAARSQAGVHGSVVLLTDHIPPAPLPFEAIALSVGRETTNVGWAGLSLEEDKTVWRWRALVRNYSSTVQERQWWVETGIGQASTPVALTLEPGETRALGGPFPSDAPGNRLTLRLSEDTLQADDSLPMILPVPKQLSLALPTSKNANALQMAELFHSFSHTVLDSRSGPTDVRLVSWPPGTALEGNQHACVFASAPQVQNAPPLTGQIISDTHSLMEGLNWQPLLVREGMVIPRQPYDRVLLWQGERPLISLRETEVGARQLFCHFDLMTSNARKLPALAILLHRFLEQIRREKRAPETANFETRQLLSPACLRGENAPPLILREGSGKSTEIPVRQAHLLRAPEEPGFFTLVQGDSTLLTAAAHFADARESSLETARPVDETGKPPVAQAGTQVETDPAWRLWTLLLLSVLLASWWAGRDRQTPAFRFDSPSPPAS